MDLLVPKTEGQSLEDRANDMENALNWLRSNGLDVDDDDGMPSFSQIGSIPVISS